jgi:hypothetical protein
VRIGVTPRPNHGSRCEKARASTRPNSIPWAALKYDTQLDGYVTGITQQQLKDAPAFSDDSWSDRAWETQTYRHYNVAPYW